MVFEDQNSYAHYHHYGPHLRKKFNGLRVYKVSIDAGLSCPNRDGFKGWGGCTYCNVDSFTPAQARKTPGIEEQIKKGMAILERLYKAEKFILYFQPNTNTYAPVEKLKDLYDKALSSVPQKTLGLAIGTRPDCLNEEIIDLLNAYAKKWHVTLEMGIESIYDKTLKTINRAHSMEHTEKAFDLLENRIFELCVHSIFGFPLETRTEQLAVADYYNEKKIDYVKLHQLHIVRGSVMGSRYLREPISLYSQKEWINFLADFLPRLKKDIVIERLFALTDKNTLIAPDWGYHKFHTQGNIERALIKRKISQGSKVATSR